VASPQQETAPDGGVSSDGWEGWCGGGGITALPPDLSIGCTSLAQAAYMEAIGKEIRELTC
jgi:hypothetical protein